MLSLLSVPLNVHVLRALEDEPKPLVELRRAVGSPPQTTMRGHLRSLTQLGVLERRRERDFPGSVDYGLGPPGRDLLAVLEVLEAWLADSPHGPLRPGTVGAKSAIKALVEGWSSTMIRALASRPLSLTELNKLISGLNYPSLERRLGAMRLAGQIEPSPSSGRSTPYSVTAWLRSAVAPLIAAANWERRHHAADSASISRIDIEALFLLAVPTLRFPIELGGVCRLAVETGGAEHSIAGVLVQVQEGRVVSCVSRLQGSAQAWVAGPIGAWLGALIDGQNDGLEVGGDCDLAMDLLDLLHRTLFGTRQRA